MPVPAKSVSREHAARQRCSYVDQWTRDVRARRRTDIAGLSRTRRLFRPRCSNGMPRERGDDFGFGESDGRARPRAREIPRVIPDNVSPLRHDDGMVRLSQKAPVHWSVVIEPTPSAGTLGALCESLRPATFPNTVVFVETARSWNCPHGSCEEEPAHEPQAQATVGQQTTFEPLGR
jgi:hypothetical protein